jgi:hypothetical protein
MPASVTLTIEISDVQFLLLALPIFAPSWSEFSFSAFPKLLFILAQPRVECSASTKEY